jgi:endonuclease/exonuclease/phosphatase family metal-dependent hydrolase
MVFRLSFRTIGVVLAASVLGVMGSNSRVHAAAAEIVLYTSDAAVVKGHWGVTSTTTGAGGKSIKSANSGFSSADKPQASPANYFELSFDAPAATTYRVWLRLRAEANSKWNDAVWVQFNDSLTTSGSAIYRIGTTSALMVNLERCNGCGTANWGWHNTAYWLSQQTHIRFATTGKHTIRVQTREDGVEIDQIVLSPVKYVSSAPGALTNDSTILSKSSTSSGGTTTPATGSLSPYKGSPIVLPGTVAAVDFDNGGQGVAYYDGTSGNSGSVYRSTDVDIQGSSLGGYNVGWTSAGEWLKYTVKFGSSGTYNVTLRTAALSSQSVAVTFGSTSTTFSIPASGGWQAFKSVTVPMTVSSGEQVLTVKFSTGGVNLHSIVVAQSTSSGSGGTGSGSGGTVRVMTWNVHHGKNTSNQLSVPSQAAFVAQQNPHVVLLQEVQTWDQNQPAIFETELEKRTGVNWTRVWAPVNSNSGTEGNLVLTRLSVSSSATFKMHATSNYDAIGPNRSVAQATVSVGGVPFHVFSTHLDYANTSYRTAQLLDLMDWLPKFTGRQIVGGDFNSTPGTYWINTMKSEYYDTWEDVTGSSSGGGTINGVRFDYLFRGKIYGDKIPPLNIWLVTTSLSDHKAVIADYSVKP